MQIVQIQGESKRMLQKHLIYLQKKHLKIIKTHNLQQFVMLTSLNVHYKNVNMYYNIAEILFKASFRTCGQPKLFFLDTNTQFSETV